MSELVPYRGSLDGNKAGQNVYHIPHSTSELYTYFSEREAAEPEDFKGYAELAAEAADAIEETIRVGKTNAVIEVDIALIPGRHAGISSSEQTVASNELLELLIFANKLRVVVDESTEDEPYGRALWQSEDGSGINLIETRWQYNDVESVKLTAVSHVPDNLVTPPPKVSQEEIPAREYTQKEQKAIKVSRTLQVLAQRDTNAAADATLDFYKLIHEWPVSDVGIPEEEAA
jgi:hypothetical protein